MQEIGVFWLRAAVALYAIGLFHTLQVSLFKGKSVFRAALLGFCAGSVLHMVAIVESARAANHFPPGGFHNAVSLFGFLMAMLFLIVYVRYRFESLGLFFFPAVFVLTGTASLIAPVGVWPDTTTRNTWLMVHVVFVLLGYVTLFLTALASVVYLIQERHLKSKKPMELLGKLPPLGTLDDLITKSLGFGFVLMTLGVVTGATWAFVEVGPRWADPRMTTAIATWAFCLLMVFLRVTAGWRGRKAALMAVGIVTTSAAAWAVHYVKP